MKISKKYDLTFKKTESKKFSDYFYCVSSEIPGSYCAKYLLETFRLEAPYLIEEIENIIQGRDYDETFLPDFGDCIIRFDPPNAIFNEDFIISLLELKMLLEEWIQFMKII